MDDYFDCIQADFREAGRYRLGETPYSYYGGGDYDDESDCDEDEDEEDDEEW